MASVDTCYISCGCNRTPHSACWGRNGLIAYGACRSVAVYRPQSKDGVAGGGVLSTNCGHQDRVNCVRWIKNASGEAETELVTASTDKTARVWRLLEDKLESVATLTGHTSTVTVVSAVYVPPTEGSSPRTLVASASVDSTVKIWERKAGEKDFSLVQSFSLGSGFAMDLDWVILPGPQAPLLAWAGDDEKIHLVVEKDNAFVPVQRLVGHEDWIRSIEFAIADNGDVLLASCGQDCLIRIWRIASHDPDENVWRGKIQDLTLEEDIKMRENSFQLLAHGSNYMYAVSVESVLSGHENWVYGVHWQPAQYTDGKRTQPMCLLSASMDKTMIIWTPDGSTGVWLENLRVGEVGGNTLGLYGCQFSPDGQSILAHGYQGAFHLWHQTKEASSWLPGVTSGGHFSSVQDISWEPEKGQFLVSASQDQTTRLHSVWKNGSTQNSSWFEIARPQVHGYDMQCLAMVSRTRFVSGADEKVLRIFDAPKNFLENLGRIAQVDVTADIEKLEKSSLPQGASVPALGLSNKAVFEGEKLSHYSEGELKPQDNKQYSEVYFNPLCLNEPPTEDHLVQNTLWPETQKLYGHGYELFAVAANSSGTLIASACKAAKAEHAVIILWDTSTWRQVCQLESHTLTATHLLFSPSEEFLLSVSRDRTWCLYRQRQSHQPESDPIFSKIAFTDKKTSVHSRIIWAASWSHDSKYFITASRDKKLVIWGSSGEATSSGGLGNYGAVTKPLDLGDAVTAVDFAPIKTKDGRYIVAAGLEKGHILLYTWSDASPQNENSWTKCYHSDLNSAHHLSVKRLKFRPVTGCLGDDSLPHILQLASCGADNIVKVYNIDMRTIS